MSRKNSDTKPAKAGFFILALTTVLGIVGVKMKREFGFAAITRQGVMTRGRGISRFLKERLFVLEKAVATQLMRGMQWLHVALCHISKQTSGNLKNFIIIRLSFPVFNLHQFFFKIAYSTGLRLLFLKTGERPCLSQYQFGIYLGNCGDDLIVIAKTLRGLEKGS